MNALLFRCLSVCSLLFFLACDAGTPTERYEAALATGLASSETRNELFLGLELAETDRQFYDRCTELNRQQKIVMGSGGNRVNYAMGDALDRAATLTFYPDFSEDRPRIILAMDVEIAYDDWSPWNTAAHVPALFPDVAEWARAQFGDGWNVVPHPKHGKVLVQVRDNRRIAFWALDTRVVRGRMTDLRALPDEPLGL